MEHHDLALFLDLSWLTGPETLNKVGELDLFEDKPLLLLQMHTEIFLRVLPSEISVTYQGDFTLWKGKFSALLRVIRHALQLILIL